MCTWAIGVGLVKGAIIGVESLFSLDDEYSPQALVVNSQIGSQVLNRYSSFLELLITCQISFLKSLSVEIL